MRRWGAWVLALGVALWAGGRPLLAQMPEFLRNTPHERVQTFLHAARSGDPDEIRMALSGELCAGEDWNLIDWQVDARRDLRHRKGPMAIAPSLFGESSEKTAIRGDDYLLIVGLEEARKVRPYRDASGGWTPLVWAILTGRTADVKGVLRQSPEDVGTAMAGGWTPLHLASQMGQPDVVRLLLRQGATPSIRNAHAEEPLHLAAGAGSVPVCEVLLKAGARPDARTTSGWTPLHYAVANGQLETCRVLLRAGAEVDASDPQGRTPLHLAAAQGSGPLAEELLRAGASAVRRTALGETPVAVASGVGSGDLLLLLAKGHSQLEAQDLFARTPLHIACQYANVSAVARLLQEGADKERRTAEGLTPLHVAAIAMAKPCVDLLLAAGANPNAGDSEGWTPLHSSLRYQVDDDFERWWPPEGAEAATQAIFEVLLALGADPNARDAQGRTPLWVAADLYDEGKVLAMLAKGGNAGMEDLEGLTPFDLIRFGHRKDELGPYEAAGGKKGRWSPRAGTRAMVEAIDRGDAELLREALAAGASLDRRMQARAAAALSGAASEGRSEQVKMLLDLGASLSVATGDNRSPLRCAAGGGYPGILRMLLEAGARPDAVDPDGWTSLCWAVWASDMRSDRERSQETVRVLLDGGAPVNQRALGKQTALHIAIRTGDAALAKLLLQRGADPDAVADGNVTPLALALYSKDERMATLLKQAGAKKDGTLERQLFEAAEAGDTERVKGLAAQGASVDARTNDGRPAVYWALYREDRAMLKTLLGLGADIQGEDPVMYASALGLALSRDDRHWLALLVECMPGEPGHRGERIKMKEAYIHSREDLDILLREGFPLAVPAGTETFLHQAAHSADDPVAAGLLSAGFDVNARDEEGRTPLHRIALGFEGEYDFNLVNRLIAAGADVNAQDQGGETPAHAAVWGIHRDMLESLVRASCNLGLENENGQTPLEFARSHIDIRTVVHIKRLLKLRGVGLLSGRPEVCAPGSR